jgi:hypothetical protein
MIRARPTIIALLAVLALSATACSPPNVNFTCTGECGSLQTQPQVISAPDETSACADMQTIVQNSGCLTTAICIICIPEQT